MANLGFEKAWQQIGGKLIRYRSRRSIRTSRNAANWGMLGGEQQVIFLPSLCCNWRWLVNSLAYSSFGERSGVSLAELVDQSFQTYPQILRNVRVTNRDRRLGWQDSSQ